MAVSITLKRDYCLSEPWKFITFIIATSIITFVAPYSGDPTWDYVDSIIISVLTYTLAPWALAVIVRSVSRRDWSGKLFVAFCMFMVPIWAYDLYILIRDQIYPLTWLSNIPLSGAIVISAGLFWNLTWKENNGASFAFTDENWPPLRRTPFKRIIYYAFIIMVPVILIIGLFIYDYFYG